MLQLSTGHAPLDISLSEMETNCLGQKLFSNVLLQGGHSNFQKTNYDKIRSIHMVSCIGLSVEHLISLLPHPTDLPKMQLLEDRRPSDQQERQTEGWNSKGQLVEVNTLVPLVENAA